MPVMIDVSVITVYFLQKSSFHQPCDPVNIADALAKITGQLTDFQQKLDEPENDQDWVEVLNSTQVSSNCQL